MNECKHLLHKISTAQFAAWELHIYLDTHPNDADARRRYKEYEDQARRLVDEYQSKYGPLYPQDTMGDTSWDWIDSPWPWETEVCN